MTSFINKKLTAGKSLPEIIKEERQRRNLNLKEVSLKTKISYNYLICLEDGDYHLLPGEIYIKQFIKSLAGFFNFSEKSLLAIYQEEKDQQLNLLKDRHKLLPKKNSLAFLSPKLIRNFIVGVIIICLVGYLGLEIKNIFTPPLLQIFEPADQTVTKNSAINIAGKTEPETMVFINQQAILIKTDGSFFQNVDLNIGLNLFEISSSKKHSRPNTVTISVLRQSSAAGESAIDRTVSFK